MPEKAINFCLKKAGIGISDVDVLAFHISTYGGMVDVLESYFNYRFGYCPKIELVHHHDAHAASAFHPSGFKDAMIFSTDYSGDGMSTLLAKGDDRGIKNIRSFMKPNSLGVFYALVTQYLGFEIDNDEYKVMGLSAYGEDKYDFSRILKITRAGYKFNTDALLTENIHSRQERRFSDIFINEFGEPRLPNGEISKRHQDIATSAQRQLERAALKLIEGLSRDTDSRNLCIAGGVGLNCVMNSKLLNSEYVDNIFVQPASSDAGCALGAAFNVSVKNGYTISKMEHVYFGPSYSDEEIEVSLNKIKCKYEKVDDIGEFVAEMVAEGKIVGWFQGALEYGPRALGSRSIIADPRDAIMKDKVNDVIKFREPFRPFAPSVLLDMSKEYFENVIESPFMTLVFDVKKDKRKEIPAVTHADGTSRIQTVKKDINSKYYNMIKSFGHLTGIPVVMNTSFNIRGQPIVCTPEQAVSTFFGTGMDYLAIGNFLVRKY